jgi:hypothetical protein
LARLRSPPFSEKPLPTLALRRGSARALLLAPAGGGRIGDESRFGARQVVGRRAISWIVPSFARCLESRLFARGVALGAGKEGCADDDRHLEPGVHEPRRVLLMTMSARVRERTGSRLASGYSCEALRSSVLRTACASFHVQRVRIWSGASGLLSAIARAA